jgi:hypothetical protein
MSFSWGDTFVWGINLLRVLRLTKKDQILAWERRKVRVVSDWLAFCCVVVLLWPWQVRRLDIGALVTIRGIGRLKMVSLTQVVLTALPRHCFTEGCLLLWLVLEDKCSSDASNAKYGRDFFCSTKVVLWSFQLELILSKLVQETYI